MRETERIRGKIIRIIDARTVIIDLGSKDRIKDDSIFYILGEPEEIVHPFSGKTLGKVTIIKSKLKSAQVYDQFTIATTRWNVSSSVIQAQNLIDKVASMYGNQLIDQGELFVDPQEIQPWKAKSEIPVRVGDLVEVRVQLHETKPDREAQSIVGNGNVVSMRQYQ